MSKILIVDDEQDILESVKMLVETNDSHEVEIVNNGTDAIKILKQNTFDLVLLDILMPKMSGIETLEKIRADPKLKDQYDKWYDRKIAQGSTAFANARLGTDGRPASQATSDTPPTPQVPTPPGGSAATKRSGVRNRPVPKPPGGSAATKRSGKKRRPKVRVKRSMDAGAGKGAGAGAGANR